MVSSSSLLIPIIPLLMSIRSKLSNVYTSNFHSLRWIQPYSSLKSPKFSSFSPHHIYSCNLKIVELSHSGKIQSARKVFDQMLERDVVSWNSMITAYWQHGRLDQSKKLFVSMPKRNVVSWNSMIAGCVHNDCLDDACLYFSTMPEKNLSSWNAMIAGFIKYGMVEKARSLFEQMPRRNVISYTAMIDGYMQKGEVDKARALFDYMPTKNEVSWTVMISGYVDNNRFDEAKNLFEQMPTKNVVAKTAMVVGFFKEARLDEAKILFDGISSKDTVAFNAMIAGYVQNGCNEEALNLLVQMLRMCLQPDISTAVSALNACSNLASLAIGRQMHSLILKTGLESKFPACHALITMYGKCGSILDSEFAFALIANPDLVSWNTIIAALAQHGLYEKAVAFFERMVSEGHEPDGITFLILLSACAHTGMVKESMFWFDSMIRTYKLSPQPEHYACLINILGRAGQLEKALQITREMPFEADSAAWGALLASSFAHSNLELGMLAGEKIMELGSQNSASYVMLSNIYAAAGMWGEISRMRGMMKEQGIKKQPACSWTEIESEVHYFLGGDSSHPNMQEIHSTIKQINLQMKSQEDFLIGNFFLDIS
nr:pentatricopeptide repeat-containing protein At4g02750-like [Ipomoea batatas]GME11627.1 pentatricopeptide repeat-containing protein At4g02750-like [Ipomoea batatas]